MFRKGIKVESQSEKRINATANLEIDARNAMGHWGDCPYWDWPSFDKCTCGEGLSSFEGAEKSYAPAPIPLRDFFATSVVVPWEEALNLAAAEAKERVSLGGQVTLAEVVAARVRLRYLEADAMVAYRSQPHAQEPQEVDGSAEPG